jgi:hypothetical protein
MNCPIRPRIRQPRSSVVRQGQPLLVVLLHGVARGRPARRGRLGGREGAGDVELPLVVKHAAAGARCAGRRAERRAQRLLAFRRPNVVRGGQRRLARAPVVRAVVRVVGTGTRPSHFSKWTTSASRKASAALITPRSRMHITKPPRSAWKTLKQCMVIAAGFSQSVSQSGTQAESGFLSGVRGVYRGSMRVRGGGARTLWRLGRS